MPPEIKDVLERGCVLVKLTPAYPTENRYHRLDNRIKELSLRVLDRLDKLLEVTIQQEVSDELIKVSETTLNNWIRWDSVSD